MMPVGTASLEVTDIVGRGRVTPATVLTARSGGSSRTMRGLGGESLMVSLMLCRAVNTAGQA